MHTYSKSKSGNNLIGKKEIKMVKGAQGASTLPGIFFFQLGDGFQDVGFIIFILLCMTEIFH